VKIEGNPRGIRAAIKTQVFRGATFRARCRRAASKAAFSTFHIAADRGEHEKEEGANGSSVESSRRRGGDGGGGGGGDGGDGDVRPRRGATVAVCTCSCLYAKRLDARSAAFLR